MSGSVHMSMSQCVNSSFPTTCHPKSFVVQLHQLSRNVRTYLSDPLNTEGEETSRNLVGQEKHHEDACMLADAACGDSNVSKALFLSLGNRNVLLFEGSMDKVDNSYEVGMAYTYRG